MIEINVKGSIVSVQETEPLYSGASDVHSCHFTFDGSWEAFGKSAVFRIDKKIVTAWIGDEDTCELPWELLVRANIGHRIEVGVYGVSKDAEILTSVWDNIGTVRDGSELGSDAKNPSPDIYEQIVVNIQQVREAIAQYDEDMAKYLQRAESAASVASTSTDKILAEIPGIKEAKEISSTSATRAEKAMDNSARSESNAAQSASVASASATSAKTSADNASQSATDAEASANMAQAEADRATIPAVSGVYNVVLTDRVTAERYALIVEDGRLVLLGVSGNLDSAEVNLIDNATGTAYNVVVESGRLILEEV